MADKVYLKCSAKERKGPFGPKICIGIKADDLIAFAKHANARGYVNLVVIGRKEIGQYGDTHSVYLDDYTPANTSGRRNDEPDPFAE